jgi:hypothetical protein
MLITPCPPASTKEASSAARSLALPHSTDIRGPAAMLASKARHVTATTGWTLGIFRPPCLAQRVDHMME